MDTVESSISVAAVSNPAPDGVWTDVLYVGQCEELKAGVHGLLLVTAAVCAAYNAAAWLRRRERHLAVNTVLYAATVWWEAAHVQGHLACRPSPQPEEQMPDAA